MCAFVALSLFKQIDLLRYLEKVSFLRVKMHNYKFVKQRSRHFLFWFYAHRGKKKDSHHKGKVHNHQQEEENKKKKQCLNIWTNLMRP